MLGRGLQAASALDPAAPCLSAAMASREPEAWGLAGAPPATPDPGAVAMAQPPGWDWGSPGKPIALAGCPFAETGISAL